jgi:hypothetical protein
MFNKINNGYFKSFFGNAEGVDFRFPAIEEPVDGGSGGSGSSGSITVTVLAECDVNSINSFRVRIMSSHPNSTYGNIQFYTDSYRENEVSNTRINDLGSWSNVYPSSGGGFSPNTTYYWYATDNGGSPAQTGMVTTGSACSPLGMTVSVNHVTSHGGSDGNVLLDGFGGTAAGAGNDQYYYRMLPSATWSTLKQTAFYIYLSAGTYTFEIKDSYTGNNGPRIVQKQVTINQPPAPVGGNANSCTYSSFGSHMIKQVYTYLRTETDPNDSRIVDEYYQEETWYFDESTKSVRYQTLERGRYIGEGGDDPYYVDCEHAMGQFVYSGCTGTNKDVYTYNGNGTVVKNTTPNSTECGYVALPDDMTLTVVATGSTSMSANGKITATITSGSNTPFKIKRDTGAWITGSTATFTNLQGGVNYTIYSEDNAGYTRSKVVKLPDISKTGQQNVTVYGGNNGSASFNFTLGDGSGVLQTNVNGGTWSNSSSSPTFNNLTAGTYTFGFKDSAGTITYFPVTITEPQALGLSELGSGNPTTIGGSDAWIDLRATGGVTPYQGSKDGVNWVSVNADFGFYNLSAGSYTFYVKDVNGNTASLSKTFTQPSCTLNLTATSSMAIPFGSATGSITGSTTGGSGGVQYKLIKAGTQLSGYSSNNVFTGLYAGSDYVVWAKDSVNCEKSFNITVSQQAQCSLVANGTTVSESSYQGANGQINASSSGANGSVQYKLMKDGTQVSGYSSNTVFNGLASGTYTLYAKDSVCEVTKSLTVNPYVCTLTLSLSSVPSQGGADGSITANGTSSGGAIQYKLGNTGSYSSNNVFTGLNAGTYVVWAKDSKNCEVSGSTTVSEPTLLTSTQCYTAYCDSGASYEACVTKTGYPNQTTQSGLDAAALAEAKTQAEATAAIFCAGEGFSNLWFGEEQFLLGNIRTEVEEVTWASNIVVQLNPYEFTVSNNPTWDNTQEVGINEVGLYNKEGHLVAIGKTDKTITKNYDNTVVLSLKLEF